METEKTVVKFYINEKCVSFIIWHVCIIKSSNLFRTRKAALKVCTFVRFLIITFLIIILCPEYSYLEWIRVFFSFLNRRWAVFLADKRLQLCTCAQPVTALCWHCPGWRWVRMTGHQMPFHLQLIFKRKCPSLDKWELDAAITFWLTFSLSMRRRAMIELSHASCTAPCPYYNHYDHTGVPR